jgi:hypothetical protein
VHPQELGHTEVVLNNVDGMLKGAHKHQSSGGASNPNRILGGGGIHNELLGLKTSILPFGISAALRLGRWDTLDDLIRPYEASSIKSRDPKSQFKLKPSFEYHLAKVMMSLHSHDKETFAKEMMHAQLQVIGPLSAAGMESYTRAYPFLMQLHILHEVEAAFCYNFAKRKEWEAEGVEIDVNMNSGQGSRFINGMLTSTGH